MASYEFDEETSAHYAEAARQAIPGYDALHVTARHLLAGAVHGRARLLSVGYGPGEELEHMAKAQPLWSLVGIDVAEPMHAMARGRIEAAGLTGRVDVRLGEVSELPMTPFDAACSLLVMHFIPDDGRKLAFLRAVAARLKPGALYLHADITGARGEPEFTRLTAAWRAFQLANGLPLSEVDYFFNEKFSQVPVVPEARVRALLAEAGFRLEGEFYRGLVFGGFVCVKQS